MLTEHDRSAASLRTVLVCRAQLAGYYRGRSMAVVNGAKLCDTVGRTWVVSYVCATIYATRALWGTIYFEIDRKTKQSEVQ